MILLYFQGYENMPETIEHHIKETVIKAQPLFSQLTANEVKILVDLLTIEKATKGTVIVNEGDPVDSVYLIVEGKADVRTAISPHNPQKTQTVATLGPKDAIGLSESGFYSLSGSRTATVIALTDMVLLRLSVPAFHGFVLSHTHVSDVMHKARGAESTK